MSDDGDSIKKCIKKCIKKASKGDDDDEDADKIKLKTLKDMVDGVLGSEVDKKLYEKILTKICAKENYLVDGKYLVLSQSADFMFENDLATAAKSSSSSSSKKRKAGEDDDEEEDEAEEKSASKKGKKGKQEEEEEEAVSEKEEGVDDSSGKSKWYADMWKNAEQYWKEGTLDHEYLNRNPDNISRIFCGNLKHDITEEKLKEFLPGIVYIKWIVDKTSQQFYGSTFIEMRDQNYACEAVMKNGQKYMGRPAKIYYCPAKPGEVWPPVDDGRLGKAQKGGASLSNNKFMKEKTPKPEGAKKLFMGNLAYNIEDENIYNFFKECGDICGLRWLSNKDTGEFRGSGYVEFYSPESADLAMALDGQKLLGRPIRLDWTV